MPALFHLSAKIISRSRGQSACAAAAYRSGEKITDDYDGITHDYRRKQHVEHATILLPENAPAEYKDRQTLWNAVEKAERQANAQLAREIEIALPRELPPEVQRSLALEFIQEQCVSQGMIADVAFHDPPKRDSHKRPLDANGQVTHDPDKMIHPNPHCHVMLTLRPMDDDGKWQSKKQKLYVCAKDGEEKLLSAADLKKQKGWEKQYAYKDMEGKKSWHTKTFAKEHPELTQVNKFPKDVSVVNPIIEKWNAKETLVSWREAWAEKVNMAYEEFQIEAHVDHRSYKDRGLDIIPTVHEGKAVTIEEKRRQEEYDRRIAAGEKATMEHTDVRSLNLAIREHNEEIMITHEIKSLRQKMERFLAPIKERVATIGEGLAEKLEHLRGEMISIKVRIKRAIGLKTEADEKIRMQTAYVDAISPLRESRLASLQAAKEDIEGQLSEKGFMSRKRRTEIEGRLQAIDGELRILMENQKYANQATKEIERLQIVSNRTGFEIEKLQNRFEDRMIKYSELMEMITPDMAKSIHQERLSIRGEIEQKYMETGSKTVFRHEAEKLDAEIKCQGDGQQIAVERGLRYN